MAVALALTHAGMAGAAEAAAIPPAGVGAVVLDGNSLWRYHTVERCSYVRGSDGQLEPREINWYWGGISSQPAASTATSPLPPAEWPAGDFDDAAWSRVRLPQPQLTVSGANPRPFYVPYAVGRLAVRGKFTLADPAMVQSCSLSLTYFGGAVVYVNGQEVARGHLAPGKTTGGSVAEDYPLEAFVTPEGKPLRGGDAKNADRLALRERKLQALPIPAGVLRKGVNVVAIEVYQAPLPEAIGKARIGQEASGCGWPPVGLVAAEVRVSPAAAATPARRPGGIQVWNCDPYQTVTVHDYGDPTEPLRPIALTTPRNGVFSGRLMVSSDQPIAGLKVTVSDLRQAAAGAMIPAAAVRVRLAEAATPEKSWAPAARFDALSDNLPAEIPVSKAAMARTSFYWVPVDRGGIAAGALAPLWFTLRTPRDAKPGLYEGTVSVTANGLKPTAVPMRVNVCDWTAPDPRDFRVHNFAYLSEDALALHYGVPRWSDRHFALLGQSLSLMAEINSRQAVANLAINFYGGNKGGTDNSNAESLVRWIADGKGGYTCDFTLFDKYLDLVGSTIGKPTLMRVNCWGDVGKKDGQLVHGGGVTSVSRLDPATGQLTALEQPVPGTEASFAFWKPVLDEVRKRLEARGWWDVTAMGHNSYCWPAKPEVVSVYKRIWPDGVWSYTAHNGVLGGSWKGVEPSVSMPVRYADSVWNAGRLTARGYSALLKPRPGFWCFTYRGCFNDGSPLVDLRRVAEDEIMMGHDGVSDFGADLFPLKSENGRIYLIGNGRGTGGPGNSTKAVLAPGPEGPVTTERFEMLREGVQLSEALLFIQRAIEGGKIEGDLLQRANRYLDERGEGFIKAWFGVWYMQAEHDARLLGLAGEVARALQP